MKAQTNGQNRTQDLYHVNDTCSYQVVVNAARIALVGVGASFGGAHFANQVAERDAAVFAARRVVDFGAAGAAARAGHRQARVVERGALGGGFRREVEVVVDHARHHVSRARAAVAALHQLLVGLRHRVVVPCNHVLRRRRQLPLQVLG